MIFKELLYKFDDEVIFERLCELHPDIVEYDEDDDIDFRDEYRKFIPLIKKINCAELSKNYAHMLIVNIMFESSKLPHSAHYVGAFEASTFLYDLDSVEGYPISFGGVPLKELLMMEVYKGSFDEAPPLDVLCHVIAELDLYGEDAVPLPAKLMAKYKSENEPEESIVDTEDEYVSYDEIRGEILAELEDIYENNPALRMLHEEESAHEDEVESRYYIYQQNFLAELEKHYGDKALGAKLRKKRDEENEY